MGKNLKQPLSKIPKKPMVRYSIIQYIADTVSVSTKEAEDLFDLHLDSGDIIDLGVECKLKGVTVNLFVVR